MILSVVNGQEKKSFHIGCIAFYNLENLFDTINDPNTNDDEFTPTGSNRWSPVIYNEKLNNMAHVISQLGKEVSPDGAAIVGLCEVENYSVLSG